MFKTRICRPYFYNREINLTVSIKLSNSIAVGISINHTLTEFGVLRILGDKQLVEDYHHLNWVCVCVCFAYFLIIGKYREENLSKHLLSTFEFIYYSSSKAIIAVLKVLFSVNQENMRHIVVIIFSDLTQNNSIPFEVC